MDTNYKTTFLALAAALYTKGFQLVGCDHAEPYATLSFARKRGERIEDVADAFQRDALILPVRSYYQNIGYLKNVIRGDVQIQ